MKYAKPSLSIPEQVQQLIDRGMVGDRTLMTERLAVVSYCRLTAYWYPFVQPDRNFAPDTAFDNVWNRYVFDRHLRLLVMDAIERIEVALRAQLSLHHSQKHGPFAYAEDPASLPGLITWQRQRFDEDLLRELAQSKEPFVERFKQDHGGDHRYLPVWMAAEVMSFGCMLTFFRGCHADIKRQVALPFAVHHRVLESWLLALNVARNICAHHGRLWNRVFGVKPQIPRKDPQWHRPVSVVNDRVFAILTLCKYCLDHIAPQSRWHGRLLDLLHRFSDGPLSEMGFPANWLDCPIWLALGDRSPTMNSGRTLHGDSRCR